MAGPRIRGLEHGSPGVESGGGGWSVAWWVGLEGLITLLGVTSSPGGDREGRGGMESVGLVQPSNAPGHAWMSGGREAEKQEPQL